MNQGVTPRKKLQGQSLGIQECVTRLCQFFAYDGVGKKFWHAKKASKNKGRIALTKMTNEELLLIDEICILQL